MSIRNRARTRARAVRPETAAVSAFRTAGEVATTFEDKVVDVLACFLGREVSVPQLRTMSWARSTTRLGMEVSYVDASVVVGVSPVSPRLIVCPDPIDNERLFTIARDDLLARPQDILGVHGAVALHDEANGLVKVMAFRRLSAPPDRCWAAGAASAWYALTYLPIDVTSGHASPVTTVLAFSESGAPVTVNVRGYVDAFGREDDQVALVCSVLEDARRAGVVRLVVEEGDVSVVFPVAYGVHFDALAMRDGPSTAAGRRRAVLHHVREHLRAARRAQAPVSASVRGVRDVGVGGMRVRIEAHESPEGSARGRA